MTPLITKENLDAYKHIADSVKNSTTWVQFVIEAELLDVKKWLGDALLNELDTQATTNPTTFSAANLILLNGDTYSHNDVTYWFKGLRAVIIYYAFARYTNRSPFNYTAAGIVQKDSDFSTSVSDKVIQRLETEARLTADAFRDEVILFLNRNATDYPLWNNRCSVPQRRPIFNVMGD